MEPCHPVVESCLDALVLEGDKPTGLSSEGAEELLLLLRALKGRRQLLDAVQELLLFAFHLEQNAQAPAAAAAVLELLRQIEPLLHELDSDLDRLLSSADGARGARLLAQDSSRRPVSAAKERLSVFELRVGSREDPGEGEG